MWGRRNPQWWKSTRLGLQLLQTCQWWRQGSASTIMNSRSSTGRSLLYDRRTDPKFRICTERIWFLLATFTMFTWVISNYLMLVSHDLPVTQFTGIMLTMLAQKENMMIQVQLNHSGKFLMLKIHLHLIIWIIWPDINIIYWSFKKYPRFIFKIRYCSWNTRGYRQRCCWLQLSWSWFLSRRWVRNWKQGAFSDWFIKEGAASLSVKSFPKRKTVDRKSWNNGEARIDFAFRKNEFDMLADQWWFRFLWWWWKSCSWR